MLGVGDRQLLARQVCLLGAAGFLAVVFGAALAAFAAFFAALADVAVFAGFAMVVLL